MRVEFSEFAYGYSLIENLCRDVLPSSKLTGAPLLPSLQAEGQSGGGYDVRIPLKGAAILIQFKIPSVLKNDSKYYPGTLDFPYFRMPLRTEYGSTQHVELVKHPINNPNVCYATPEFTSTNDLSTYYLARSIVDESAIFDVGSIGNLSLGKHWISYDRSHDFGFVQSDDPVMLEKISLSEIKGRITKSLDVPSWTNLGEAEVYFQNLTDRIRETAFGVSGFRGELPTDQFNKLTIPVRAAAIAAMYYRVLFGLEMIIVGKRTP